MPANPLFSRAHSTFYQHVLSYKSQFQHYLWASVDLYAQKKHRQTTFCGSKLYLGVEFRTFLIFDIKIGIGVTLSYN